MLALARRMKMDDLIPNALGVLPARRPQVPAGHKYRAGRWSSWGLARTSPQADWSTRLTRW